jgi:hypothetical protein
MTTCWRVWVSRICRIAVTVALRESGGVVMRELMERNSGTMIPTSGCCDARSARKVVYRYNPIYETSDQHARGKIGVPGSL